MNLLLLMICVPVAGAFLCLLLGNRRGALRIAGPAAAVACCVLGIGPAVMSLVSGERLALALPWQIPLGSFSILLDPLSALFLVPILVVCAVAAVYGADYLRSSESAGRVGVQWFCFNMLMASMITVVLARNAILFLLAWEIMSLASFFLVMFDYGKEEVRRAGWIYLVATHIGTAFLLVMFVMLGSQAGSFEFDSFHISSASTGVVTTAFVFAVVGFGTKAGFIPLHVWLPEAHPAAPSHVSAVMSGVMIKTGIYGFVRMLAFLGDLPPWWGWMIVAIGAISSVLGVLFALAQHDLKRLLAYHSVENIGIIALGIGIGMLGVSYQNPAMMIAGFAGGLLHVVNHALFKSLLFLSAGSVLHATGTREMDHLGGLLKKMPATAAAFVIGSAAICGLPPLNGFVSEFLVYAGAFSGFAGAGAIGTAGTVFCIAAVVALALTGGLAIACFTKALGIVFLGECRSSHAEHAHEAGPAMRIPMAILVVLCFAVGLSGPLLFPALCPAVRAVIPIEVAAHAWNIESISWIPCALWGVTIGAGVLIAVSGALMALRSSLLAGRKISDAVTWDCGYAAPTPRMQYTSSSFASPITKLFSIFLGTYRRFTPPKGLFPSASSFSSETPDFYRENIYKPMFSAVEALLARFRWLQHGRVNLYILCIVVALLVLLAWKLG